MANENAVAGLGIIITRLQEVQDELAQGHDAWFMVIVAYNDKDTEYYTNCCGGDLQRILWEGVRGASRQLREEDK